MCLCVSVCVCALVCVCAHCARPGWPDGCSGSLNGFLKDLKCNLMADATTETFYIGRGLSTFIFSSFLFSF